MKIQHTVPKPIRIFINRLIGRNQIKAEPITKVSMLFERYPVPSTNDPDFLPYFQSLPSKLKAYRNDLFGETGPVLWLDQANYMDLIEEKLKSGMITESDSLLCKEFAENGYIIVKNLISADECDRAWQGFMRDWKQGRFKLDPEPEEFDALWGRVGNIHHHVKEFHDLLHHAKITRITNMLMGKVTIPYQTIPSFYGSEQKAHSDAIHMTTFPLGYMSAAWIALEDIHPDSGPLEFYPRSHKLPYILSKQVGIQFNESEEKGRKPYIEKYETYIQNFIKDHGLERKFFNAKKGDVLIWHHNLIHGGSPVNDPSKTRKSLVCHYFTKGTFAYHDLTNSVADVENNGRYKETINKTSS